jgi:hypothetical protein
MPVENLIGSGYAAVSGDSRKIDNVFVKVQE